MHIPHEYCELAGALAWELPRARVQNWKVRVPPRGMPPAGVALLSRSSRRLVL